MDIKTPEEIQEQILVEAMDRLKTEAQKVINGVMSELYTDYLPYVVTDTEGNIGSRVLVCVSNLIAGKFTKNGEHVVVKDGYGQNHYLFMSSWSDMVKPLCDTMTEEIKGARIAQLEREVAQLKANLEEAYKRF